MGTQPNTPQPVSILINLWDILTSPSQALRRVSTVQTRTWWFPALLALLAPIIHLVATLDLQVAQAKKAIAIQLSAMPPDQVEAARPLMERMAQPTTILLTASVSTVVALALAWTFAMLILYFGIALLGTPVRAQNLWTAVLWTWVPLALRPLVQMAWNLYSGTLIQYPGLSFLVSSGDPLKDAKDPLYLLAAQIDLFNLWHLILIFLLLRVVGRLGRGSSLFITLFYALILGGVHILPALTTRLIGM